MNMWNKNGVSLVTVLLFMLVATIAATATFKWLTSEGRSSSSRMLQREAYQSAIAGIESARSWMTYHGNDVGSLIKQFEDKQLKEGHSVPILLNSQLTDLIRPGQNFKVWLVGVNTSKSTYKLKLLSKGESRNGSAKHNELAILNVDGLYRVNIPKEKVVKTIPFEYNYYGGSVDETAGGINATSMVVNGNWTGNPTGVNKNFIVTGNATLTGNTITVGSENNCIGGDFKAENAGATGGNIYVGGDGLAFSGNFTGNAYFENEVQIGTGGNGLTVTKDMYLGDKLTMRSQKDVKIDGNLCLGENATVQLHDQLANATEFKVKGNLWIPPSNRDWLLPTSTNKVNFSDYDIDNAPKSGFKLKLGEKVGAAAAPKIYMPNGVNCSYDYKYFKVFKSTDGSEHNIDMADYNFDYAFQGCGTWVGQKEIGFQAWDKGEYNSGENYCVAPGIMGMGCSWSVEKKWNVYSDHWMIFRTTGNVVGSYTEDKLDFSCGESAKTACSDLWEEGTGCGNSSYVVPDILKAVDTTLLKQRANSAQCIVDLLTGDENNLNNMDVTVLNNCHSSSAADELFNGYLVISDDQGKIAKMLSNPSGTLSGKFVFYPRYKPGSTIKLPPTTADASVLVYLPDGASTIQQSGSGEHYNYFVYSLKDVGSLMGSNKWTGSFYFPVSTCARISNMQTAGMTFEFNSDLIADLTNASLICDVSVAKCGSGSGSGSSSSSSDPSSSESSIDFGGVDSYYISNAPQLSVSIESQYKNNESEPSGNAENNVQGDFIVLPRVIFLPADAPGHLDDYYNILRLNKYPAFEKSEGDVSCDAGLPTSGLLSDPANLATGQYRCTYSYNNKNVKFYVIVSGPQGTDPPIGFKESFHELEATDSYTVKLHVPAHATTLTVNFQKPDDIDDWTIQPASTAVNCAMSLCNVSIPSNASEQDIDLFNVTTSGAESGTAIFTLRPGVGYNVGVPGTLTLQIQSNLTVYREEATAEQLQAYCDEHDGCPEDVSKWPECQDVVEPWVLISGSMCVTKDVNNRWVCATASDISLNASDNVPDGCISIVPDEVLLQSTLVKGDDRYLHASLKAQQIPFRFGFAGKDVPNGTKIWATVSHSSLASRNGLHKVCTFGTDVKEIGATCTLDVFSGERVRLSFDDDDNDENDAKPTGFHYWSCTGDNCPVNSTDAPRFAPFAISAANNAVYAHFNELDKHCFFDEFKKGMGCTDDGYCIGYSGENAKWNVIAESGSDTPLDRLEYGDGYIALNSDAARGANKQNVTLMSTAVAGTRGYLKAQFRPSRLLTVNQASLPSTVTNSGFFIHADESAGNGLFLTIYIDKDSKVVARLLDNAEPKNVYEKFLKKDGNSLVMPQSEPLITLTVDVVENRLTVSVIKERYYGALPENYTAVFELENYSPTGEYVGLRLADPSIKLYDIGWKSDTYFAECWDTYPTLSCSFKGTFPGAVVPKGKDVLPWVGLSSWFDAKGCYRKYYYQGDDACSAGNSDYSECSPSYNFSETGAHGYTQDGAEKRTARAGVGDCFNLGDEKDKFLAQSEWAHCGAFWVGEQKVCKKTVDFLGDIASSVSSAVTNFNLVTGVANVRSSDIVVELEDNNGRRRVEIYLLSQEDIGAPVHYSKSGYLTFEAGGSKTASIKAEELFDADGFNPEKVYGIALLVLEGSAVNVDKLYSYCPKAPVCKDSKVEYIGDHWLVTTNLTNYVNTVGTFVVQENNNYITPDYTCTNDGCDYEELATPSNTAKYKFEIKDNPYDGHMGDKYKFTVTLTTKDRDVLDCGQTNEKEIKPVTPSCIGLSNNPDKFVGGGLPQFKYKMSDCPPTGCPWKITLERGGNWVADITSGTAATIGDAGVNTDSDAANTEEYPLTAGTGYYFKLQPGSGDNAIDFTPCVSEQQFEIKEVVSSSSEQSSSSSEESSSSVASSSSAVGISAACEIYDNNGSSTSSAFTETGNMKLKVTHNATTNTEARFAGTVAEWNGSANANVEKTNESIWLNANQVAERQFTAPTTAGTYTYTISLSGNPLCSATLDVSQALTCSAPAQVGSGASFTLTGTYTGSNCTGGYTHNMSGSGTEWPGNLACNNLSQSFTAPTTPGSYNYMIGVNGSPNATCTRTVQVVRVAPTFDCKTGLNAVIGQSNNVTIGLQNVLGCDEGGNYCYYGITGTGSINRSGNGYTSGNLPAFTDGTVTTDGTKSYTVRLTNSVGYDEHDCSVEFTATPSFPCNDANSTAIAKEYEREDNANSCTKYTMDGASTLQVGCWWAPETPVTVNIMKCDGTTTSISHSCGGWQGVNVGGPCTVYLQPEKKIKWKFNNW